jgi:hypothetical protein
MKPEQLRILRPYFNVIECSDRPIQTDKQMSNKHMDEVIDEILPYYFMWLIKSNPKPLVIKQKYEKSF